MTVDFCESLEPRATRLRRSALTRLLSKAQRANSYELANSQRSQTTLNV